MEVYRDKGSIPGSEKGLCFLCRDNDPFPNNNNLEVCIYKENFSPENARLVEKIEQCFEKNRWPPAWRNGLYEMHHFHSKAHEVLGVYSGWVQACFGGPGGRVLKAAAGDVIIIPAGVSHRNLKQSADFKVVGAYPEGQRWNMKFGTTGDRPRVDREIQAVSLPQADPVYGKDGPLLALWGRSE